MNQASGYDMQRGDFLEGVQTTSLPLINKFEVQQGQKNSEENLKHLSLAELAMKLNAVKQLRKAMRTEKNRMAQTFHQPKLKTPIRATAARTRITNNSNVADTLPYRGQSMRKGDKTNSHDSETSNDRASRCSYISDKIDDRSFIEMQNIKQSTNGAPTSSGQADQHEKKRAFTKRRPVPDFSKVHRQAYIQALATKKAKDVLKKAQKGNIPLKHLFDLMFTPSYTFSYFGIDSEKKRKGKMESIIGKTDIYKYYPRTK
ncbi:uncharacterized protein [Watersipora subatra]|uniref:uncharacterized protein n=1 Tax=Watersipora subatra TaxID=2589382 RepID=UPI00355B7A2A